MPPKRLTDEELQHLLSHVKVRVDPAFNKALQAELRARARELRAASEDLSQGGRLVRDENLSAHGDAGRDQKPHRRWNLGRLSTINVLSTAIFATAALAFVFLVLLRPLPGGRAVEPDLTPEATEDSIALTGYPVDVELTEEIMTDSPTPETPMLALTATASPTPTVGPTLTPSAVPTPAVTVTCSWTQVTGYVELSAPYVRVTVSTAAFPITQIGEAVGPVQQDGSYSVTVSYPEQPASTRLIGGYGEWDGTSWLRPATTFGADCQSDGATAPPPPTPLPMVMHSVQFWPDIPILDRTTTVNFGSRINYESHSVTRARMLAFYTYQGETPPGESACMSQQMPGRGSETFWSTGTYTELAPGASNNFEQSFTYSGTAPADATHLVMWLIVANTNNDAIGCWQKLIELSPISP